MKYSTLTILLTSLMAGPAWAAVHPDYAGSVSCRKCHENFYELWAPSFHGTAMQPYSRNFAQAHLTAQSEPLTIGAYTYQVDIDSVPGVVIETGPQGQQRFEIAHVLGGKNVYYFLTPYRGGRLQTLPVAYEVHQKQWFDTAASGVRHFPAAGQDTPVHWTDPMYTFNTSCHGCHVSQLSNNYDVKTDTYHTQWAEPGINCETCHGPCERHVELFTRAEETDTEPNELGLVSTKSFTVEQTNSMCASCHGKMSPITGSFMSGERFFDHFDLVTLENPDYYPDGRDLGENYTMTSWHMSPCVQTGRLDCMHCHTSSGRYRFAARDQANGACLPCHQAKVDRLSEHSHHPVSEHSPQCVSCHMPMTTFAHMNRTDHSMRPPVPAATLKYQSDNACNLCHTDPNHGPFWAQSRLIEWDMTTRQANYLKLADYVDRARKGDWRQLDAMLAYVQSPERDEIVATSLIRLLRNCPSEKKWSMLSSVLAHDTSPLVRAAAAEALEGNLTLFSVSTLLSAVQDDYRLVRVRAAGTLAGLPSEHIPEHQRAAVDRATGELFAGMLARPDDYGSHYNLGNLYMKQGRLDQALQAFQTSSKLRPDFVPPYANVAFVHYAQGDLNEAEQSFQQALKLEPDNTVILTNLGLLQGEMGHTRRAEQTYRRLYELDPNSSLAAYNLGSLLVERQPLVGLAWCQKAYQLEPDNDKFAYAYAFYLNQQQHSDQAIMVLKHMTQRGSAHPDAYVLLGQLLEQTGTGSEALEFYQQAAGNERLPAPARRYFSSRIQRLMNPQ